MARYLTLVAALGLVLLALCSGDYNPFADTSNARMHLTEQSFAEGDSVPIFSAQTITVRPAVHELIDSFSVEADSSRLCRDTMITALRSVPYSFEFSFVDTGIMTVRVTTYRRGGDISVQELRCRAFSPLRQDTVRGFFGEPIELATDSVADPDVVYTWDFGNRSVVRSLYPRVTDTLYTAYADSGEGFLWVTDGAYRSPAAPFVFLFNDTGAPLIEWVNRPDGDTLVTAERELLFKVHITDRGGAAVHYASINGEEASPNRNLIYARLFTDLEAHPSTSPLEVVVQARDNPAYENWARDTFYVAYDESGTAGTITELTIDNVERDTVVSRTPYYRIFGSVHDYGERTVVVALGLNGEGVGDTIFGTGSGKWDWSFALDSSHNTVRVSAGDTAGNELAARTVTIIHNPAAADTTGPVVVALTVNGRRVERREIYTADSVGAVRIEAFDERTGIASVRVNGEPATAAGSFVWTHEVAPLAHARPGTEIAVVLTDSLGNAADTSFVVFRNSLPRVSSPPALPYPAAADSIYGGRIGVEDADGDLVAVVAKHLPPGMTLGADGALRWEPTLADTGADSIVVQLTDGFQFTETVSWPVLVIDASGRPDALRLATRAEDLPRFLEVGAAPLRVALMVDSATGKPPYAYGARVVKPPRLLLDSSASNVVAWEPTLADTGHRTLELTAWDSYRSSDTLHAGLLVVPPNRPCTLTVAALPDTTAQGAVDLSSGTAPETLTVRIADPDLVYAPVAERHLLRAILGGVSHEVGVDTAGYGRVVLDPTARDTGGDTLRVVVEDRTGSPDTVAVPLYYGSAPAVPRLLSPADSAELVDTTVELVWRCSDPDGNPLVYDVSFGAAGEQAIVAQGIADTSWRVSGVTRSGAYYWRVVARDHKSATSSEERMVLLRNPRHVRLATGSGAFPAWLAAGSTMSVVLRVEAGSGSEPLGYAAVHLESGSSLVSDGADSVVSWTPEAGDTGYQHVQAIVRDGWGNADTVDAAILVVPRNQHPCSLSVAHDGPVTEEGAIDMTLVSDPVTLTYTIHDEDHPLTERYRVRIIQANMESRKTIDTTGRFQVIVNAAAQRSGTDTIRVIVGDQTETFDTLDMPIWYGSKEYVKRVVLNTSSTGAQVTAPVQDFPVLVRLSASSFDFARATGTGGGLRFRTAAGVPMSFEIERWDRAGQTAEVWVRVPAIKAEDSTQYFELYVDTSDMTDGSNAAAVFRTTNDFVGVWHMHDGTGILSDATGNGNDAASTGSFVSAGVIDGAHGLPEGQSATVADNNTIDLTGSMTVSAWVKLNDVDDQWHGVLSKRGRWGGEGYAFFVEYHNGGHRLAARIGTGTIPIRSTVPLSLSSGTWLQVVWRFDGSGSVMDFFANGQQLGDQVNVLESSGTNGASLRIGLEGGDDWLDGDIDELRLSRTARGDEWIKLSYESQRPGGTLVSIE